MCSIATQLLAACYSRGARLLGRGGTRVPPHASRVVHDHQAEAQRDREQRAAKAELECNRGGHSLSPNVLCQHSVSVSQSDFCVSLPTYHTGAGSLPVKCM